MKKLMKNSVNFKISGISKLEELKLTDFFISTFSENFEFVLE